MAIRLTVDKDNSVFFTAIIGSATIEEMRDYIESLYSHPEIKPDYSHLVDLRETDEVDITSGDVKQLTELKFLSAESKLAIVAPLDFYYGMARMYEIFRQDSPVDIQVFRSFTEATEWLGYGDEVRPPSPLANDY